MTFPTEKLLESLRRRFPVGLRIELIEMVNDPDPVPSGTLGTVIFVEPDGSIAVAWDNGRSLSLLPDAGDCYRCI